MILLKKAFISALILATAVVLQGCAGTSKKGPKKPESPKYGDFDKVVIPNKAPIIARMISTVQPELDLNTRNKIANDIHHAIKKFKVEPQIMVALIDTESNFNAEKISSTGDLSIAQINVEVWNQEFQRMKIPLIKKSELMKKDQAYAMDTMARILSILKSRHGKKDRRWYARYHSNTTKYKTDYLQKIEIRMKMLAGNQSLAMK